MMNVAIVLATVFLAILLVRVLCALPDRFYTILCGCRVPFSLRHPLTSLQTPTSSNHHLRHKGRLMVVLGSGGHTAEMLTLLSGFNPANIQSIHFFLAKTDHHSRSKAEAWANSNIGSNSNNGNNNNNNNNSGTTDGNRSSPPPPPQVSFHKITRSREVGQSWCSTIGTTLVGLYETISLYCHVQPDVVLCNGPGTCVPVVYCAVLGKLCGISTHTRLIFIESFARVQSLSLTGMLVYPVVDRFIVQWKQLNGKWSKGTEYIGKIF